MELKWSNDTSRVAHRKDDCLEGLWSEIRDSNKKMSYVYKQLISSKEELISGLNGGNMVSRIQVVVQENYRKKVFSLGKPNLIYLPLR